jgi:DNA recombination protein RmuC
MEFVFPVSMLALGLVIGTVSLWFITRTKLKYEFERGRADGETERATLIERLAGKDSQLQELAHLRLEHGQTLASLSALQTRLEEERKASQEKLTLLNNAETKLADAFKALSADALRSNNQSFLDLAKQNLETFQQTAKNSNAVKVPSAI